MLLEMDLENQTQKLTVAKRALEEADLRLKRSEEKKLAYEELKRKEVKLNANITNMNKNIGIVTERIEGKKTIVDNLLQRQASLDNQMKLCLSRLEQAGLPVNQPYAQLASYIAEIDD